MKNATSEQLTKKEQRRSTARLEQEYEIPGLHITRNHLETLGYDTANVDDSTMQELANNLGGMTEWESGNATDAADELNIPKHAE